jgi:hypothetical protein
MIDVSAAAMVLQFRLRTVGLEDEVASPSASVYICVQCVDLMAKGDEPPQRTRPLDHRVYLMVREVVTSDPSFTLLSWLALRKGVGLPAPTLIEPKILKAFNELRRVMAIPAVIENSGGEEKRLQVAS